MARPPSQGRGHQQGRLGAAWRRMLRLLPGGGSASSAGNPPSEKRTDTTTPDAVTGTTADDRPPGSARDRDPARWTGPDSSRTGTGGRKTLVEEGRGTTGATSGRRGGAGRRDPALGETGTSAAVVGRLAARRRQELAGREAATLTVDIEWRTVVTVSGAFIALVALAGFLRSVPRTATAVAVAGLLALALNPAVAALQRWLPIRRGSAVAAVFACTVGVLGLVALLLVPPAVSQARDLGRELPRVVADIGNAPIVGERLREAGVPEKVDRWVRDLPERLAGDTAPIERAGRSAVDGLVAVFVTLLLAFALLVDGERIVRAIRRLIPFRRLSTADRAARLAYESVGRYVAGSILVALFAGVCTLIAGLVLGVPLTPLAAVNVTLFDLVPQIGGAAGGIPFVLLGLTKSVGTGAACAVFFILYLQLENHVVQPLVVGKKVDLSPPATMCAALIGVSAGGVVGALLAVPTVGAAKAVYVELRREKRSGDLDAAAPKRSSGDARTADEPGAGDDTESRNGGVGREPR